MTNPFEELASDATKHTRKKIEREAKIMAPTPVERAVMERREQLAQYKQWKAMIRRGMSQGLFGPEIIMLFRLIRKTPSPQQMVDWVAGSKWLLEASSDTRYAVFGFIDTVMIRWNVRHGLAPLDDGLWTEPDTPFVQIRKLLTQRKD